MRIVLCTLVHTIIHYTKGHVCIPDQETYIFGFPSLSNMCLLPGGLYCSPQYPITLHFDPLGQNPERNLKSGCL